MLTYYDPRDLQARKLDDSTTLFLVKLENCYQLWGIPGSLHQQPKPANLSAYTHYWLTNSKSVAALLARIERAGMTATIFSEDEVNPPILSLETVIACFGFNPETVAPIPFDPSAARVMNAQLETSDTQRPNQQLFGRTGRQEEVKVLADGAMVEEPTPLSIAEPLLQEGTEVGRNFRLERSPDSVQGATYTIGSNGIFSGGPSLNRHMREALSHLGRHGLNEETLVRWQAPLDYPSAFDATHKYALIHLIINNRIAPKNAIDEISGLNSVQALTLTKLYSKGLRGHHLSDLKATMQRTYPNIEFSDETYNTVLEECVNEQQMSVEDALAFVKSLELSQIRRYYGVFI